MAISNHCLSVVVSQKCNPVPHDLWVPLPLGQNGVAHHMSLSWGLAPSMIPCWPHRSFPWKYPMGSLLLVQLGPVSSAQAVVLRVGSI